MDLRHGFKTVEQAALALRCRRKASIFVRKTLQVLPCEIKKALAFVSSQKGPAFFDEDDACGRFMELHCRLSELLEDETLR